LLEMEHTEFTYDTLGRVMAQTEVYQKAVLWKKLGSSQFCINSSW
jgi:hypothetical protein